MKSRSQHDLLQPDIFDVLSATWVFACNDENPIITYEGIRQRLNLSTSFDITSLVQSRGDLFRRGVPPHRLEAWKQQMRTGRHLPGWIRDINEEPLRRETIDALTVDDVFRSQFRAEDGAPRASLEVITWRLQHIDRLRKANYEAREGMAKSWQMWLVFGISLLNICATILAVLCKKSP